MNLLALVSNAFITTRSMCIVLPLIVLVGVSILVLRRISRSHDVIGTSVEKDWEQE